MAVAADVANDELTAFKTYDAVVAYDALNTDIDAVWLVKITLEPLTANEPVIVTLPVNC